MILLRDGLPLAPGGLAKRCAGPCAAPTAPHQVGEATVVTDDGLLMTA